MRLRIILVMGGGATVFLVVGGVLLALKISITAGVILVAVGGTMALLAICRYRGYSIARRLERSEAQAQLPALQAAARAPLREPSVQHVAARAKSMVKHALKLSRNELVELTALNRYLRARAGSGASTSGGTGAGRASTTAGTNSAIGDGSASTMGRTGGSGASASADTGRSAFRGA